MTRFSKGGCHELCNEELRELHWEVLKWFDSEAAAWVSVAAETVDYFR